jgi:hypothetical protein
LEQWEGGLRPSTGNNVAPNYNGSFFYQYLEDRKAGRHKQSRTDMNPDGSYQVQPTGQSAPYIDKCKERENAMRFDGPEFDAQVRALRQAEDPYHPQNKDHDPRKMVTTPLLTSKRSAPGPRVNHKDAYDGYPNALASGALLNPKARTANGSPASAALASSINANSKNPNPNVHNVSYLSKPNISNTALSPNTSRNPHDVSSLMMENAAFDLEDYVKQLVVQDNRVLFLGMSLHAACVTNNEEMTQLLLNYDADIYLQDNFGQTALHVGAMYGHLNIIELLLQKDNENRRRLEDRINGVDHGNDNGDDQNVFPNANANGNNGNGNAGMGDLSNVSRVSESPMNINAIAGSNTPTPSFLDNAQNNPNATGQSNRSNRSSVRSNGMNSTGSMGLNSNPADDGTLSPDDIPYIPETSLLDILDHEGRDALFLASFYDMKPAIERLYRERFQDRPECQSKNQSPNDENMMGGDILVTRNDNITNRNLKHNFLQTRYNDLLHNSIHAGSP